MNLYNLTLQRGGFVNCAIYGNFSGNPKSQEVLVGNFELFMIHFLAHGSYLVLYFPDDEGNIQTRCEMNVFGLIRTLKPLRLTGETKDYVVIGTASGNLTVLEYLSDKSTFKTVHCEAFGKTGVRRIVPGEYLAIDPQGRAVMIAALEKQKYVYVTNRDAAARLTISSPLEAHKNNILIFDLVSVDVSFDNPLFASLEVNYDDLKSTDSTMNNDTDDKIGQKVVSFYELDLGLNHVVRKDVFKVSYESSHLISIPGGEIGPGGVVCCSNHFLSFLNLNHEVIKCNIPQRNETSSISIITSAVLGQKGLMFVIIQNEIGDLFRITLKTKEDDASIVSKIEVEYFDTLPVCRSICITRKGLLFAALETGDHILFQIFDNVDGINGGQRKLNGAKCSSIDPNAGNIDYCPHFIPRAYGRLRYLDSTRSFSPSTKLFCADFMKEGSTQMCLLNGKGSRSKLSILRNGLACTNVATSKLPGRPIKVFTVKENKKAEVDKYIIVSFLNVSLILSVGEKVLQVKDSGLITNSSTIFVSLLEDDSVVQIHSNGVKHIKSLIKVVGSETKTDELSIEWSSNGVKVISGCATLRQVCIVLENSTVVYFELDEVNNLIEVSKLTNTTIKTTNGVSFSNSATAVAMRTSNGERKSQILAISYKNKMLKLLSLKEENRMEELAIQALPESPSSLCFYKDLLCIGLINGVFIRTKVNETTGKLYETKSNFLGTKPVILCPFETSIACLSSRTWILHYSTSKNRLELDPLSYEQLSYTHSFSNEQCDGLVSITFDSLKIFYIDNLNQKINSKSIDLDYTPRQIIKHPLQQGCVFILEADCNVMTLEALQQNIQNSNKSRNEMYGQAEPLQETNIKVEDDKMEEEEEEDEDDEEEMKLSFKQIGYPTTKQNKWVTLIKTIDPNGEKVHSMLQLDEDEYGVSIATVRFRNREGQYCLVVGTVVGLNFYERAQGQGFDCFLKVFKIEENSDLILINKTQVKDIPKAIAETPDGRLIVCLGTSLCLYDLGEKHLLLKSNFKKAIPKAAIKIQLKGKESSSTVTQYSTNPALLQKEYRVFIADNNESILVYNYYPGKTGLNAFALLADDVTPRVMTCLSVLDYDTVVGADKFGNIFVLRMPEVMDEALETAARLKLWDQGTFDGAPNKFSQACCYFVGEIVTSTQRIKFAPGRPDVIIYSTINGTIGVLVPFGTKSEAEFFAHFENILRQNVTDTVGREHLSYRSNFIPVKKIVDADLMQEYFAFDKEKQKEISDEVDRTVGEISNKVEDLFMRLI